MNHIELCVAFLKSAGMVMVLASMVSLVPVNILVAFNNIHRCLAYVIDTAAYWSAYCYLPEEKGLVSIDFKIDSLTPVIDQTVIVKGKRVKAGKTIYLTEAQMFNEDEQLVVHGTSKLMVIKNKQ